MISITGKVKFDPQARSGNAAALFKPGWVIVSLDCDIDNYYAWFIKKRYGIRVLSPAWGPHISVVRGFSEEGMIDEKIWSNIKEIYHNKEIEFLYDTSPRTNGNHWWLKVESEFLYEIREKLGIARQPRWNFHLTVGVPHPLDVNYSHMIKRNTHGLYW